MHVKLLNSKSLQKLAMTILLCLTIFATGIFAQTNDENKIVTDDKVSQNQVPKIVPINAKTVPNVKKMPSLERVGVDVTDSMPLSLNDAIRLALENNNDIDASRNNVQSSEYDLKISRSAYDPIISGETNYEKSTSASSSSLNGGSDGKSKQSSFSGNVGLSGIVPFQGGSFKTTFDSSRTTTNNQFSSLNPQYSSGLKFSYTQPLFRNRSFDNTRRNIEVAKKNLSLTDTQFRNKTIEVIAQIETAYWDLVYALKNLQVQNDAVKEGREQLQSIQRQVEAGKLAPIDVVAAENQVTTFEQGVYTAQETVTRAENTLKTLMLPDYKNEMWSRALIPVTSVLQETPKIYLSEAIESAMTNRPEIAELKTNKDINNINSRYYKNQLKPEINLTATYNPTGLAGTPTTNNSSVFTNNVSPNLVGGYGTSLSNLFSNDYSTIKVGVSFSLPLKNRKAEAEFAKSKVESNKLDNQLEQKQQVIAAEVRNTMQAMRSAEARLASATSLRITAEKQYESEQRRFQAGSSTLYLVLERQQSLVNARGSEFQAQTDLNKAIANFQKAIGNTMQSNNVSLKNRSFEISTPTFNRPQIALQEIK